MLKIVTAVMNRANARSLERKTKARRLDEVFSAKEV